MTSELKYPVQPFVFEFAKEASKSLNFNDIHIKNAPYVDMAPVESYLKTNSSFLNEYSQYNKHTAQFIQTPDSLQVDPIFFDPAFDLKKATIFDKVFPKGCLRQKLFAEQLLAQLDTVQSLLFHSTDNHAYEFFKSFSNVHDMHSQLSVLLPQVRNLRHDLQDLDKVAQAPQIISDLKAKKQRLLEVREVMLSIKKVTQAIPAAESLADSGDFEGAFNLLDEMREILDGGLIAAKALRPYLERLKKSKETIGSELKKAFFNILTGCDSDPSPIVRTLRSHDMIDDAVSEAISSISGYAAEQVQKILVESSEHYEYGRNLSKLSLHDFTEVLSYASPNIRSRILTKYTAAVERVASEFGVGSEVKAVSQTCAESVFEEVIHVISHHPLNNATIEDFCAMFDTMLKFVRDFDSFDIDKSKLQASLQAFSRSFVEAFDCSKKSIVSNSFVNERWQRCAPTKEQLEIVKKLTTNREIDSLVINDAHFSCTSSLLVLVEVIYEYIHVARSVKKTADDIAGKLAETVVMYCNTSYDDLLKAEAVKNGRLKNISTKHLALAAANMEFLELLVLYLKPRLKVAGANETLIDVQMGRVLSTLKNGDEHLKSKILDVLMKKVTQHFDAAVIENDSPGVYVERVAKEVTTLHGIVTEHLPSQTATAMFSDVPEQIARLFEALLARTKARAQVARDVQRLNELLESTHISIRVHSLSK